MKINTIVLLISILLFLFSACTIFAIYDPLSVPNNHFGVHIADLLDLDEASRFVNSSDGDWGYITFVIQDGEKNSDTYQKIFDSMRRLHIIPIVRLATHVEGSGWVKPKKEDAQGWVRFLNSLNWPVQNRYIVLFNEPNHALEWGNSISPEEYSDILTTFSQTLKEANSDFFILPAALDVSASNTPESMDALQYWTRMYTYNNKIFNSIDGWNSHSYPNPGFTGSPYAAGRGTIQSFLWETDALRSYGIPSGIPIFITETGWKHSQGKITDYTLPDPYQVGEYLKASASVWSNKQIVAVTPFLFNYQDTPFDHFSFRRLESKDYYPNYDAFVSLPKIKGKPLQIQNYKIHNPLIARILVVNSKYTFHSVIQNNGQNILSEDDGYELKGVASVPGFIFSILKIPYTEPGKEGEISLTLDTPNATGSAFIDIYIEKDTHKFLIERTSLTLVPPPSIDVSLKLGFRNQPSVKDVKALVYDLNDTIVYEFTHLNMKNGHVILDGLHHIIPGNRYRVVIIVPGYLPRQTVIPLSARRTDTVMKRLLPFDLYPDGAFTLKDIEALIMQTPAFVFRLLF